MKPIVSIIAAAIRTHLWPGFYRNLKSTKTPFEIIFIGPEKPNFLIKWRLPKNFKFIFSEVKVPQCMEAAARIAEGEYLLPSADDILYSENAVDKLYAEILKAKNDLAISSISWFNRGVTKTAKIHFLNKPTAPLMPNGGMIKKNIWHEFGGLDNRFVASHAITDLVLRIYQKGGFVVYADAKIKEIVKTGPMLWTTYGQKYDHPELVKLWTKDGKFCARTDKFYPYKDEGILEKSQGFIGDWKGK